MFEVCLARLKQHDSNNEHHSQPDTIKQLNVSEQANIEIRLTCRAGLDIHTRVTLSGSNVWFFLTSLSPSQSSPQQDPPDVRNKLMTKNVHHVLYHRDGETNVWCRCDGRQQGKEKKEPQ